MRPQTQLRSRQVFTLLQIENTTRPFQSKPSSCGWLTPFLDARRHDKSLLAACQFLHRQTTNLLQSDAEIPISSHCTSRFREWGTHMQYWQFTEINSVRRVCTRFTTIIMHYDSCWTFLVDWLVKISFLLFFLAELTVRFVFWSIALRDFGNIRLHWSIVVICTENELIVCCARLAAEIHNCGDCQLKTFFRCFHVESYLHQNLKSIFFGFGR